MSNNKVLTESQIDDLKEAFAMFDENKDGEFVVLFFFHGCYEFEFGHIHDDDNHNSVFSLDSFVIPLCIGNL